MRGEKRVPCQIALQNYLLTSQLRVSFQASTYLPRAEVNWHCHLPTSTPSRVLVCAIKCEQQLQGPVSMEVPLKLQLPLACRGRSNIVESYSCITETE
ncbi:Hypothetical predicted protein [Podarcis lilfordi]|uniref:Uncharacterized protein n=1 Tax=Podarcis lilfordi TaxID=74358 RepID=A0AA35JTJ4_9SAUR|nr:Hypothetical predicted protein [Podarcis lilfordi]